MKVLFTTHPASSHLEPMLPLMRECAARGWEVVVAAPEPFGSAVRKRGLAFRPAGLHWLEASAADAFPELKSMPLDEQGVWWVTDIFAGAAGLQTAEDLSALCAAERPDLIVRDYWDFGAWAAATAAGVPCAVVGLAFHTPAEAWSEFIGEQLTALLRAAGAAADRSDVLETLYDGPYIDLLPESYQTGSPRVAARMAPVARPFRSRDPAPAWVAQLAEPRVLVTFGTVFNKTPGVFDCAIEALADEPTSVIVTTGADVDPASLGPLPPNFRAVSYADYNDLLPRCAAVVCHAGFNTVMAALAHDLPVVALPISADQPLHAARCHELGVGFDLGSTASPDAIRTAVRAALDDRFVRQAAARLGAEIRTMPSAAVAADALEQYVGSAAID